MKDKISRYTLRLDSALLAKFGYIAEYNGRTKNKELEQMIKHTVSKFEEENGKIEVEE